MRRLIPSLILVLALIAVGTVRPSDARVSANINLTFGRPAPWLVVDREPAVVLVPGTRVYYAEDTPYDMYRYGPYWYVCDQDTWYRARSYRGPFVSVALDFVPQTVVSCYPGRGDYSGYGGYGSGRVYGGGYGNYGGYGYGGYGYGDRSYGTHRDWDRERGVYRGDWDRERNWNRDGDRRWQNDRNDRGDWQRGDWDHGHGNHGRGEGHGRGHGRGHGDDDDDD